jgi:transcriptional regulator of acetoin/glycerol metabolism
MLDDDETCIGLDHLPQDFFDDARDAANAQAAAPSSAKDSARLDDLARSAVAAALETHAGNVSAAARMLGVSRNTLYRKMAALDQTRRR